MKTLRLLSTLLLTLAVAISCNNGKKGKILPTISGKAGEIAVVSSKGDWESETGNAIRAILAHDCPFLPQTEPLYNLFHVPTNAFNNVFKMHRNIIFISISDAVKEPEITIARDIWATPQTVVKIEAPDQESAANIILDNEERIGNIFEQAERDRILSNSKKYEEGQIRTKVAAMFGGSPYFPSGYSIKKTTFDFIWISYETSFTNQSIFIYKYPYEGSVQFTPKYLSEKRNEVTRENIPCTTENSYMIINPMIAPGFKWIKYKNKDFAESRGLWEAYNDYMGGPYVSHAFLSKDSTEIIVLDGFVYAPKYPKRNYIRQVESILYSFEWKEDFTK